MSQKFKLRQLNYKELEKRLEAFREERRILNKKLNNGNVTRKAKRKKRLDDLDKRLIPLVNHLKDLRCRKLRKQEMPFTG